MKVFSIHDSAAEAHMRPFCARNEGEALRAFGDLANDEEHPVGQHPECYTLFVHGSFDEENGQLLSHPKQALGNAIDYVKDRYREMMNAGAIPFDPDVYNKAVKDA